MGTQLKKINLCPLSLIIVVKIYTLEKIFLRMKKYHVISRVAIYMLALVLIGLGIYHFVFPRDVLVYLPPNMLGNIWLPYVVGAAFALVGVSFLTNQYVKFTGYFLAIMLALFIVGIHFPNYLNSGDEEMRHLALMNMLKDTALMGFSMHIAAGAHHQHLHIEEEAD
jgi:uncharacterized membrane protein